MLADEPVASLDPATSHKVLAQLQRIGREDGITTVVSLHQVDLAQAYADRVIGLAHGRVVFDGAPAGLTLAAQQAIYRQGGHSDIEPAAPAAPRLPAYNFATIED
jgi:phosphonate transport system ATP-binding protein